jgi:hypothetical protein
MITNYARPVGRDRRNVLVENGVVVRQYVVDTLGFRGAGNPELVGQPEASLQALGFEQIPGPLKMHWRHWVSMTPDELKKDEEEREKFIEESAKEALKVSGTTIEIHVPKFYPTLGKEDWFTIERCYVSEGDIVQADDPLVSIDCAIGLFDIPVPPQADKPYRVEPICVPAGSSTHLGELILVLEQNNH